MDFPALLAGNWLNAILLPLILYAIFEGKPLLHGWSAMTEPARKEFRRNSGILVGVYLLLFGWVLVRDVYQNHAKLLGSIREKEGKITALQTPAADIDAKVEAVLTGINRKGRNVNGMAIISITFTNKGSTPHPVRNVGINAQFNSEFLPGTIYLLPPSEKIPFPIIGFDDLLSGKHIEIRERAPQGSNIDQ